jgi:hypothetical protein
LHQFGNHKGKESVDAMGQALCEHSDGQSMGWRLK